MAASINYNSPDMHIRGKSKEKKEKRRAKLNVVLDLVFALVLIETS
jgi:hypothetical protein